MTDATAPKPRGRADALKALGTLLAGGVAMEFAGATLAKSSVLALAVQAVVAELTASRLGVAWTPDDVADGPANANATSQKLATIGKGAAFGFGLASFVLLVSLVTQHAELALHRSTPMALAFALISAILPALRDEALFRGSVLRVSRFGSHRPTLLSAWTSVQMLLVCALVAAAYAAGQGASPLRIVSATALSVLFTALWLVDGTAWRPVAAHAAWSFVDAGVVGGGIVDVHAGAAAVDAFRSPVATSALSFAAFAAGIAVVRRNRHIPAKVG